MNLTDYHAKYFARELTKRCPSCLRLRNRCFATLPSCSRWD